MHHVTTKAFTERFPSLVLHSREMPRRADDLHILLLSAVLSLSPERETSEADVNADLQKWILEIGGGFGLDHVTLRRYLIDSGLLTRDASGTRYHAGSSGHRFTFDPEIRDLDLLGILAKARQERAERRRRRLAGPADG